MRWAFERRLCALGIGLALGSVSGTAFGSGGAETTYGRIDGDVCLVAGIGGVVAPRAPRAEAELRVRYLESVGLFATYEDAGVVGAASQPRWVGAAGLELRPVFLYRWLEGLEVARARFDLTLDSLGLELGATLSRPSGTGSSTTPGIQIGLGVEVPVEPIATGPWLGLHGGLRWAADALAYGVVRDAVDRAAYLTITLAWHQIVATHLVDLGDQAPR